MSGWTTENALADELPAFEHAEPEVGTLLIGANDIALGVPAGTFRARYRRLLAAMTRIVGGARRIVAVTIPDFSVKPWAERLGGPTAARGVLRRFNAVIRAEARRMGVPLADIGPASRAPADPSPDGLHPSEEELRNWTDAIEPVARRAWRPLLAAGAR